MEPPPLGTKSETERGVGFPVTATAGGGGGGGGGDDDARLLFAVSPPRVEIAGSFAMWWRCKDLPETETEMETGMRTGAEAEAEECGAWLQ